MISWNVPPCSLVHRFQRFGGTCCIRLQHKQDYEDWGNMFSKPNCTVSHPRRPQYSPPWKSQISYDLCSSRTALSVLWLHYWMDNQGIVVWFPAWGRDLFLLQSGSVAHLVSYSMSMGGFSPGVKPITHLHLLLRLGMSGTIPPLPHTPGQKGKLQL